MKARAKTAFFNKGTLYKKGDVLEIETASFNPILMTEIETPEVRITKAPATPAAPASETKPARKTRKAKG